MARHNACPPKNRSHIRPESISSAFGKAEPLTTPLIIGVAHSEEDEDKELPWTLRQLKGRKSVGLELVSEWQEFRGANLFTRLAGVLISKGVTVTPLDTIADHDSFDNALYVRDIIERKTSRRELRDYFDTKNLEKLEKELRKQRDKRQNPPSVRDRIKRDKTRLRDILELAKTAHSLEDANTVIVRALVERERAMLGRMGVAHLDAVVLGSVHAVRFSEKLGWPHILSKVDPEFSSDIIDVNVLPQL